MRLKSILPLSLAIVALNPILVLAESDATPSRAKELAAMEPPKTAVKEFVIEKDKYYIPEPKDAFGIKKQEKDFNFDWNNVATIAENQNKIPAVETFLKKINNTSELKSEDQQTLGKLLYKLGTYYTHVAHQPNLAIAKMNQADGLLTNKDAKAWNYDHLAYAYEQKYVTSRQASDRETALYYSSKVITDLYPNTQNKAVAFAYCIKGLVHNDALDYSQAETNFSKALLIYERIPGRKDDQYARVKNSYADILLEQNGRDKEAVTLLMQSKEYWESKERPRNNPYAARNLVSLSQAHLKTGNVNDAQLELKKAISIYENVYGSRSQSLITPYTLLSVTYKKLGNQKLADAYEQKVNELSRK